MQDGNANVDVYEGIKMLKDQITNTRNAINEIQQDIQNQDSPMDEGVLLDISMLRAYQGMTLLHISVLTKVMDGQMQILEGIMNHINEQGKK